MDKRNSFQLSWVSVLPEALKDSIEKMSPYMAFSKDHMAEKEDSLSFKKSDKRILNLKLKVYMFS